MSATQASRRNGRRGPLASVALILIGLVATGGAYAAFSSASATAAVDLSSPAVINQGQKLFAANCSTCHGQQAQGTENGPSLIGVGSAAVDFQVGTGRMPMQMSGPQALSKPVQFTDEQTQALAAYVASLAPGPAIPSQSQLENGDVAAGGELFRINCAMCHNVAGAGGALTEGKFAPQLTHVSAVHVYEAMLTGPQNMPVFNDLNLTPEEKKDIISYLSYIESNPSAGGLELSNLGPVSEGLFLWVFGLGAIVALTVWITAKSN
ncbi:cytochrome bc1 complex diheme cytochrome c subunit [Aurantimicrobium minutum]|uniref:cytochrome bc1 complex diheme cytochrome c subunit n=1 Tax=Aurantimicrobium minutum TaxID=708131 RepID=UPI0024755C30|nr:c-type cytochrome [Aurantimicrobium minutum]